MEQQANEKLFECNVYFVHILIGLYIYYIINKVCNSLKITILTKTKFTQYKITLERTLIVSYLKMINKMSRLPAWKNFCGRP